MVFVSGFSPSLPSTTPSQLSDLTPCHITAGPLSMLPTTTVRECRPKTSILPWSCARRLRNGAIVGKCYVTRERRSMARERCMWTRELLDVSMVMLLTDGDAAALLPANDTPPARPPLLGGLPEAKMATDLGWDSRLSSGNGGDSNAIGIWRFVRRTCTPFLTLSKLGFSDDCDGEDEWLGAVITMLF